MNIIREPPERDVHVLNQQSQMTDNFEIPSTASSDISESLRAQILGKAYIRQKPKPRTRTSISSQNTHSYHSTVQSFEVIPNSPDTHNTSSFEIISLDRTSGGDRKSLKENRATFQEVSSTDRSVQSNNLREEQAIGNTDTTVSNQSVISMKISEATENKNYSTQTQSVAIQTLPMSTDCGCLWTECTCKGNDSSNRPHCVSHKKVNVPDENTSVSTFGNYTETSSQTLNIKEYKHCRCTCKSNWYDYETQSTSEQFSDNSEDSYATDFLDLPYQNNEEYLKVLHELEKKLIARNRERVRKTMLEFERRSRQNQNLDKPVWDYSDDNASVAPRKHYKNHKICCKCGRNKKADSINSDIMQNEKRWEEMNFVQSTDTSVSIPAKNHSKSSKIERSLHKSHWQLDPRSGEWMKVSCFQQTDYHRPPHPPPLPPHGDYVKDHKKMPPPKMCMNECYCRQKKRR